MKTFKQWLIDNNTTIAEASRRTGVHRYTLATLDTGKPRHKATLAAVARLTEGALDMSQYEVFGSAKFENQFGLSVNEVKAAQLYSDGRSTAEMCEELNKTAKTIEHYFSVVLKKTEGNNRRHAVAILRKAEVIS